MGLRTLAAAWAAVALLGWSGVASATSLEPAFSVFAPRGPALATGVIIYSHGRSPDREDSQVPAPAYLRTLALDGWDVLRFDRQRSEDTLSASSAALARHVDDLHGRGYARIVLVGQSFGGFLSLMAAAPANAGSAVDAVVATAPAAYGSLLDTRDDWKKNASELYRVLGRIERTRVFLAFFTGDEFDPGGRADRAREILAGRHVAHAVLDQPAGLFGHTAASSAAFARSYADCVEAFLLGRRLGSDVCGGRDPLVQLVQSPG